jgi:hypothetical protein
MREKKEISVVGETAVCQVPVDEMVRESQFAAKQFLLLFQPFF